MLSTELGGKLTGAFPTVTSYRVELGGHYNILASIYMKMQKPDEAISAMRQSVTEFRANQNSLKLTITNMVDNKAVAEHVLGGTTAELDLSEDGQYIAVLTSDRLLLIEAESGRVMQSHPHPHISVSQSKQPSIRPPVAPTWEPLFLSYMPNQQKLVTMLRKTQSRRPSKENLLQIWDISIPQKTEQLVIQQKSAVHALEVGVQKEIFLSGSLDAAIRLFDHEGKEVWARTPSSGRPNHKFSQPSFDPSGKTIRTIAYESLRFVDADSGKLRREFPVSEILGQSRQGDLLAVKVSELNPGDIHRSDIWDTNLS